MRDEGTNLIVRLRASAHGRADQARRDYINANSKRRVVRGGRQAHRFDGAFTGRISMSREEFPLRRTRQHTSSIENGAFARCVEPVPKNFAADVKCSRRVNAHHGLPSLWSAFVQRTIAQ